jgi:hypothetical protein
MKVSLIATSIRVPIELEAYARNVRDHGHTDVEFIVIGDRRSDLGVSSFCRGLSRNYVPCEFLNIEAQQEYLATHRSPIWKHLSFDSRQRRIVGMLKAWENGADLVICIDSHDRLTEGDFVGSHMHVGGSAKMLVASTSTGWFNTASLLSESNQQTFFARGFPLEQREISHTPHFRDQVIKVAANSGFCLGYSDLDAITHLDQEVQVSGLSGESPERVCLAPGTWSPFPAHNLSLRREVVPAYFLSPYVGRYDDIWASYIVSRIAGHLGEGICFGSPAVVRNSVPSNLAKGIEQELVGYRQTDRFCEALRSIPLSGTSYHECFGQVAAALPRAWTELPKASGIEIEARNQLLAGIAIWHDLIESIHARSTSRLVKSVSAGTANVSKIAALSN